MKKLILFITLVFACFCFSSCHTEQEMIEDINKQVQKQSYLIELTFDGEKHEFVFFNGYENSGLSHWPGCKYCKEYHYYQYY